MKTKKIIKHFHNLEDKINVSMGEIEQQLKYDTESVNRENELKNEILIMKQDNPEMSINDGSVERAVERKRLKFIKFFAIIIEALLSYNAVNLFLKETIGISMASNSQEVWAPVTMAKSMMLAVPVAYVLLWAALQLKYNDIKHYSKNTGVILFWYKFSWILPVLVIPFLNLFIVFKHPDHSSNLMWIFFSVLTLLINVKLVTYASQYNNLSKEKEVERRVKPINNSIKEEERKRTEIRKKVQTITNKLRQPAIELRRVYESFGSNKPALNLNPIQILILNTYIYYTNVLPIGIIENSLPPESFSNYFSYLNKTISPKSDNLQLTREQEHIEETEFTNQFDNTNARQSEEINNENSVDETINSENEIFI